MLSVNTGIMRKKKTEFKQYLVKRENIPVSSVIFLLIAIKMNTIYISNSLRKR